MDRVLMENKLQPASALSYAQPSSFLASAKPWQAQLSEPLRARALEAAHFVAERMLHPEQVVAVAEEVFQQAQHVVLTQQQPQELLVEPGALIASFTGPTLPCTYFKQYFPAENFADVTHRYLTFMAQSTQKQAIANLSLFSGAAGLAMILATLRKQDTRYTALWQQVNRQLCEHVQTWTWKRAESKGVADQDYDVITGASGMLTYLLSIEKPDENVRAAIATLVEYLIWLAGSDIVDGKERKRWYISPEFLPRESYKEQYPHGYFNCGLAHGIPGPLAALALTWLIGYRYPGLHEAIQSTSTWLLQQHITDDWGINWAMGIPWSPTTTSKPASLPPSRTAWCYGAPGIARALWFAGHALEDETLQQTAIAAIEAVLQRPLPVRDISAPTVCHGIAGLLAICLRFTHETENSMIQKHIPILTEQILGHFDPTHPLGFQDHMPYGRVNQVSWLTGAPGTALVLLAAATETLSHLGIVPYSSQRHTTHMGEKCYEPR